MTKTTKVQDMSRRDFYQALAAAKPGETVVVKPDEHAKEIKVTFTRPPA